MADCCIKVYTLERVLTVKKDLVTKVGFLDEAMKVLENKPSTSFWTALGASLDKQVRDAAKGLDRSSIRHSHHADDMSRLYLSATDIERRLSASAPPVPLVLCQDRRTH